VLGVTFKPNTDDMRDAPSLTIVPALVGAGAKVRVTDPQGRREGEALLPGVTWVDDAYAAADGADAVVILTEWNEFRALDLRRLAGNGGTRVMADLRNVYAREDAVKAGFADYAAWAADQSIRRTRFWLPGPFFISKSLRSATRSDSFRLP
jgi:UDPglucose 6-dehydrogenase